MNPINENSSDISFSSASNNSRDSMLAFCQNAAAEARLQRYQIEQHKQDIQSLQDRVQNLELHKATQFGQDKIVGFLVGAIVLSVLSLVTTFFFRLPPSSQPASNSATTYPDSMSHPTSMHYS